MGAQRKTGITRDRKWAKPFEAQVARNHKTGCLEWTGYTVRGGYGCVTVKRRRIMAHRYWYEKNVGPIPEGAVLMHTCDNPACVELSHLRVGTQQENCRDAVKKDRSTRGVRNGRAAVSEDDVIAMRAEYESGARQTALAEKYGIHQTNVSLIVRRKHWAHVA